MPYVRFEDVGSVAHMAWARGDGWRVNLVQFMDELSEKKVLQVLQTKCKSAVGPKSLRFLTSFFFCFLSVHFFTCPSGNKERVDRKYF